MVRRHLAMVAFVGIATMVWGAGCSSAQDDDLSQTEGEATPPNPATLFDQADSCDRTLKRHAAVREVDFEQGVIRWSALDVPGVTEPNLGQEYCEYNAVQNGKIIKRATDIVADADPEAGGRVSCVFTAVFTGANQQNMLKAEMAAPENLGVAASANGIVQMQVGFNSRGAATQLFKGNGTASNLETRLRTTATFQARQGRGERGASSRARPRQPQRPVGGRGRAGAEVARTRRLRAAAGYRGVHGRVRRGRPVAQPHLMICARVGRAAQDFSCRQRGPERADGSPSRAGSTTRSSSCRFAKGQGEDYPHIVICDLTDKLHVQVSPTYPAASRPSAARSTRRTWSSDPLPRLQTPGTCRPGRATGYMTVPAPQVPETPVSEGPLAGRA